MAEFYAHERLAKAAAPEHDDGPHGLREFLGLSRGFQRPGPHVFPRGCGGLRAAAWGCRSWARACTTSGAGALSGSSWTRRTRPAQRAYALGFLCHYALDQVIHPYVRWQCRPGGDFSMEGGHGYLEEAIDSALYCKDNPKAGSLEPPVMELGVFLVEPRAEEEIDELLRTAIRRVYGGRKIAPGEFRKAFARVRWAKRYLMHPTPGKLRFWHILEKVLRMDCLITSHCSPLALPACDFLNEKHVAGRTTGRRAPPARSPSGTCWSARRAARWSTCPAPRRSGWGTRPARTCCA